ncbi:reverse transcriptase domain-containing protein [Tanacetum coccineum]|uniref:Reverse transcriptase domain-containing protein n=1 Tax=Tanacetum coccineum TaxID=301880 RepID=A0ABQ4YH44_9ASTR
MIDVFNKKITLRVGDDEVIFDMDQSNIETKDKKGEENLAADHLSRLENLHMEVLTEREIADKFPNEHLMVLKSKFNNDEPWYADFVNDIVGKVVPPNWTFEKRKRSKTLKILAHCHSRPTGAHRSANVTAKKVNRSRFYWPSFFKGANEYVRRCDACQRSGNISLRNEMPQNNIQVCEVFDVWGLDFMGPFPQSRGNKYILVAVDYVFKWVEAQALPTNDARIVVKFLGQLFASYGKAFHLPVEIEHEAHWALKQCNIDLTLASESRLMHLNELAELRDGAYENTRIYKERTKKLHDSRLRGDKDFKVGDEVLIYNSHLKMYPGKLKLKWSGPNIVKTVYPYGAVEIIDRNGFNFKVNGQRLKKYYEGNIYKEDDEVIEFGNGVT